MPSGPDAIFAFDGVEKLISALESVTSSAVAA
jgi:hypothetical protein